MCAHQLRPQQVRDPLSLEVEAQQVLDDLWKEKRSPFQLNVGKITKARDEYTIHFYDARMRTARVPLLEDSSFREMVRIAVLARIAQMTGP